MVAADYLRDTQVRQWLDGVEPAWMLLTFDSLRALLQEPSAVQTAIRIANDLSVQGFPIPHSGFWPLRNQGWNTRIVDYYRDV
jgi:hypothetical protein